MFLFISSKSQFFRDDKLGSIYRSDVRVLFYKTWIFFVKNKMWELSHVYVFDLAPE
ncbi:hypothetical protein LEP1GSC021_4304 [Leptospira noguchii str. 1993005606]|nr:hypothetical protein LEP1GSC021_4304 [Leptospira noguchii str. 1993005606]